MCATLTVPKFELTILILFFGTILTLSKSPKTLKNSGNSNSFLRAQKDETCELSIKIIHKNYHVEMLLTSE